MQKTLTTNAYVPGVDFSKWADMVKEKQDDIDKADTADAFAGVVNGILHEYGFSHIMLFTPEYGQQRQTQRKAGIGIRIEIEETGLRVVNVFPDSPAADIGLQPGDLITTCDGHAVRGVPDLAGDVGQKSTIIVNRDGKDMSFDVTRREYKTVIPESVTWVGDKKDIAVLTIPTFDVGYNPQHVDELMAQIAPKAKGVILDLRGNGGGRVVNLQHLAGYFVDAVDEPIGTFIGRRDVQRYEDEYGKTTDVTAIAEKTRSKVRAARLQGDEQEIKVPVAVLIDGGTGSASEMMAAALKEIKGAPLVGSESAGAVLASVIVPNGDDSGFWVQYPMLDYVTIKGHRLEGNGLKVDQEAARPKFGQPDAAINDALVLLKSKIAEAAKVKKDGSGSGTGN